eukprot:gene19991-20516_t
MISAQVLLLSLLGLANVFTAFATTGVTTEAKNAISPAGVQLSTVSDELFAILGGSQCAEQLYYGPTVISTSYSGSYFSTNTLYGAYSHDQWLEIVTSDGVNELFRIYWQFSTKKSLADRFINAPTYGEAVSYRIVDTYGVAGSVGAEYTMSGTWYFSNGAAITASNGSLNANAVTSLPSFWGVANIDSSDASQCSKIWVNGALYGTYSSSRTFMYIVVSYAPPDRITNGAAHVAITDAGSIEDTDGASNDTNAHHHSHSNTDDNTIFAVVGGTQCAESLYYGTAALTEAGSSDGYSYYMKTNPTAGYTAHTDWLQIVSDGSNELFRIYWTFSVARTLSDRFVSAVNGNGEAVSYRVVDTANVAGYGAGYEFTYSGASWQFSNSASMSAAKFTTIGTYYGFSADDGCWGAGTGTLNANWGSLSNFWGIASTESYYYYSSNYYSCSKIYVRGYVYSTNYNVRPYMYIVPSGSPPPSATPTQTPTTTPTASPSQRPTARPTKLNGPYELFAVVGSNSCAGELAYGPATLTEAGSSDGNSMYFSTSTSSGQQPHTEWLQIVTTGTSGELFRIYWTFSTAKTLADRFVNAPTNGESVSYRVVDTAGVAGFVGTEYLYSGTWRFSDGAAITASKFTNTYTTSTGFSADDGAWGAAPNVINAKAGMPLNFWGVGNLYDQDYPSCNKIYANGNMVYSFWRSLYTVEEFMYC